MSSQDEQENEDLSAEEDLPTSEDAPSEDGNEQPESEEDAKSESEEGAVEEELPPVPEATQRVHIYENGDFIRTIDRVFTEDEANAFVKMFTESSRHYKRKAFATELDDKPPKKLAK